MKSERCLACLKVKNNSSLSFWVKVLFFRGLNILLACDFLYYPEDNDDYIRTNYKAGARRKGYGGQISEYCQKSIEYNYMNTEIKHFYKGNCKLGDDSFGKTFMTSKLISKFFGSFMNRLFIELLPNSGAGL